MKKLFTFLLFASFLFSLGCRRDVIVEKKEINRVCQFVYDGLSNFYLWNSSMTNKKPTVSNTDPKKYFKSVLHPTDTGHGWSWITDDVEGLLAEFEGESTDAFGFQPFPLFADETKTKIIGFIRYVFPGTPAADAGLKRGEVIIKINGATITEQNYLGLYGANQKTTFTVLDQQMNNPREVTLTPSKIETDPVLFSKVYEIEGHKIGYLFYTNFIDKYNESLFNAFEAFKAAGIEDLVVDLRYNTGGHGSSAIYLASLIAPQAAVQKKEIFATMSYNALVNAAFDENKWDRNDYLGSYDSEKFPDPLLANLNLNKVYIIATGSSYSASELTTFCLKPFMDVIHIGEKTGGKYTASWTLHAYNNFDHTVQPVYDASKLTSKEKETLKNWAMQPIVGRYTDKNKKDFIDTDGLIPNFPLNSYEEERNTENWRPIGDPEDYLFAKAISLITGKPYTAATRSTTVLPLVESGLCSPMERIFKSGVILNHPPRQITE